MLICLQELNFKEECSSQTYLIISVTYYKNRLYSNKASGGSEIVVHKSNPSIPITINFNLEVTVTKIIFKK